MFTERCFIRKNTPELRAKLEILGYEMVENGVNEWHISIEDCSYLTTDLSRPGIYMGTNGKWHNSVVDCGGNEELFLSVAALRDDSDKYQWFTNQAKSWDLCLDEEADYGFGTKTFNWHKATVSELIAHFGKKSL